MKRTSSLWGSISILIGVVIAILSLVRGAWEIPLLIGAFAVWGLWLILAQLRPAWRRNLEYRRRDQKRRERESPSGNMSAALLHHVNHRISEHLRAAYPNAQWEWTLTDPVAFISYGGTGRIRVYGIPDFDFADVTLDRKGGLSCALVKVSPLDGGGAAAPNQQTLDPGVWFELHGRTALEDMIADLRSRGHNSLTLKEDGSISIQPVGGGEEISKAVFSFFPDKVYWARLAKILEQEGLNADVQDSSILVSW